MKKLINLSFLGLALSMGLTSCLKDDILLDPDKTQNVVELVHTSLPQSKIDSDVVGYANSFEAAPSSEFPITVRYTGAHTAPEDIVVTVAIDPTIITTYNTQNGTNFVALPSNLFTFPTTVTIPKGGKEVVLPVALKTNQFDFTKSYALPLKIESVSNGIISGNFGRALFAVTAKNQYDGIYSVQSGRVQRYTAPTSPETTGNLNGPLAGNPNVRLITVGENTVEIAGLQWANGSNSGVAGIDNLQATVDPATNKVTMRSVGNPSLANWVGKDNRYDPATKTFYLAFDWNQTANRREYEVVLKYVGPR